MESAIQQQTIKDKAPKPAGLVLKNLQAFVLVGLALFWGLTALGTTRRRDVAIRVVSAGLLVAGTATIPFIFP